MRLFCCCFFFCCSLVALVLLTRQKSVLSGKFKQTRLNETLKVDTEFLQSVCVCVCEANEATLASNVKHPVRLWDGILGRAPIEGNRCDGFDLQIRRLSCSK